MLPLKTDERERDRDRERKKQRKREGMRLKPTKEAKEKLD